MQANPARSLLGGKATYQGINSSVAITNAVAIRYMSRASLEVFVRISLAAIALSVSMNPAAYGATILGRITYISSDHFHLMLDNCCMYTVSPGVDLSFIAVADRVKLRWNKSHGEDVITAITKAPITSPASG
jgi:hypothetical protein